MKTDLSFDIFNTTNGIIPITILDNPLNPNNIANATTKFEWNVTSLGFANENVLVVQYKPNNTIIWQWSNFQTLPSLNLQGLLSALNSLNLATFYTYTSGGNTYIATNNDNLTFNNFIIFNPSEPILQYAFITTGTGGNNIIDVNSFNEVTEANPSNISFKVSVLAGALTDFYGTTDNTGNTLVQVLELFSGSVTEAYYGASSSFNYSFTCQPNTFHVCCVYDV